MDGWKMRLTGYESLVAIRTGAMHEGRAFGFAQSNRWRAAASARRIGQPTQCACQSAEYPQGFSAPGFPATLMLAFALQRLLELGNQALAGVRGHLVEVDQLPFYGGQRRRSLHTQQIPIGRAPLES
jgi:hypothetical protein